MLARRTRPAIGLPQGLVDAPESEPNPGPQPVERLRDVPTAEALNEHAQAYLGIA